MSTKADKIPRDHLMAANLLRNVSYARPDWNFVVNLVHTVLVRENPLSNSQEKWIKHFVYKYRDQIRDQVIYEERIHPDLQKLLGDDVRVDINDFIDKCEEFKEKPSND